MYKLIKNSKGDRWMKDGKFVKADSVPEEEKLKHVEVQKLEDNKCLFCGKKADHKRLIAGLMVPLCDDSVYIETVGSITAQLRKKGLIDGVHKETPVGSPA